MTPKILKSENSFLEIFRLLNGIQFQHKYSLPINLTVQAFRIKALTIALQNSILEVHIMSEHAGCGNIAVQR